jgi:hypothetical protein
MFIRVVPLLQPLGRNPVSVLNLRNVEWSVATIAVELAVELAEEQVVELVVELLQDKELQDLIMAPLQ